jgi:DNA-binding LacI/PurR family transcriptional regulator
MSSEGMNISVNQVTIKEVAKKAKVSPSTVSRVINNNYPVSNAVRENVLKSMRDLNYQPNGIARSLKSNKTQMIGFVVADISNPFFMQIAKAMENVIGNEDHSIVFCSSDGIPEKEKKLLESLNEKRVEAMVIASSDPNGRYIRQLVDQGMPIVLIDRKIKEINTDVVVEDNYNTAYLLTKHLIDNGHRKIAIINASLAISVGMERFEGFKAALQYSNITLDQRYVLNGSFQREDSYTAVKKMIAANQNDPPTAIFCCNNIITVGTVLALKESGLKIPDDISVVSFGTMDLLEFVEPKLTIATQSAAAIGYKTGKIIMDRINHRNQYGGYKEYIVVPEIKIRDSVKPLQ